MDKHERLSEHFSAYEFSCRCCGRLPVKGMDPGLIARLEYLRGLINEHLIGGETPLHVLSGYRCPKHNKAVGGVSSSYHTKGQACDLAIPTGLSLDTFADLAHNAGFKRVGRYYKQHFLHVDVGARPSPASWTDKTK